VRQSLVSPSHARGPPLRCCPPVCRRYECDAFGVGWKDSQLLASPDVAVALAFPKLDHHAVIETILVMATKSLKLLVGDAPPFDEQSTWFETFIGTHVLPLTERHAFQRFWFSRYGAIGQNKHMLFRFEIENVDGVQADIDALMRLFPNGIYEDYDVVNDIGVGERSRFLGQNIRQPQGARRGELAFSFLHATAELFLHALSGPDANRRWHLEPEVQSGFSQESSMEQFHHLFCNLTGTPTHVTIAQHPRHGMHLVSRLSFIQLLNADPLWAALPLTKVMF
jgi:hypothetical protein